MGFFDSLRRAQPPEPAPRRRLPEWFHPGHNVAPALLPVERLITRRPELAAFISVLRVYPGGFEFDVDVLRRLSDARDHDVLHRNPFARPLPPGHRAQTADPAEAHMRFGVRFADGRSAAVDDSTLRMPFGGGPPDKPFIKLSSGRSSPGHWHRRFWVWGLPGSGDIELVYSWPAEGVSETAFAFDGDAVRAAAAKALVLWDEPDDEDGRGEGDAAGIGR